MLGTQLTGPSFLSIFLFFHRRSSYLFFCKMSAWKIRKGMMRWHRKSRTNLHSPILARFPLRPANGARGNTSPNISLTRAPLWFPSFRARVVEKEREKGARVPPSFTDHTFVKDSPPRQGSYKEMSGESKGVIG